MSSSEADFMRSAQGLKDILWIENILQNLKLEVKVPQLFCDNQGAIKTANSQNRRIRTRCVDIRLHLVKDEAKKEAVTLHFEEISRIKADMLTVDLP